jgi:hypothetical protein
MEKLIANLINESIKVETNLFKLYSSFSKVFIEDASFWSQLASEERDHASLIHSAKTLSTVTDNFPVDILSQDLNKIMLTNQMIEQFISSSKLLSDRFEAAKIALKIESSSSELSFQKFMKKLPENDLAKIFVKINYFDVDHAKRICEYFNL